MSARDAILGRIRERLGGQRGDPAAADERLARRPAGPLPARATGDAPTLLARFTERARAAASEVVELDGLAALPAAVRALAPAGAPSPLAIPAEPDTRLDAAAWAAAGLVAESRPARDADDVAVSHALCGVAETGTLVLRSGPGRPTSLAFLPATHVIVLERGAIVGGYETAWQHVRAAGAMPRTVNWITGPSRSADIEQTLQLGAHGPVRLVIMLV